MSSDAAPEVDAAVEGSRLDLSHGVYVLDDEQGVRIMSGDRTLMRLPTSPIEARTYTETAIGPLAIWSFERRDEQVVSFERSGPATLEEDAVVMPYAAEGGGMATLSIRRGHADHATQIRVDVEGLEHNSLSLKVGCDAEGGFMGFGEQYNAVDQRGEAFELFVSEQGIGREGPPRNIRGDDHTTYFPMPWWIDPRGHGVLFFTYHRTLVDVCATDAEMARIEITEEPAISALIFHGPTMLDVIDQLGDLIGRPKRPPSWAFEGPWISAQGGTAAVRAVVDQLAAESVPYSAIWSQDWTGVRMNFDGGLGVQYRWTLDAEHYPDLQALVDDLHGAGKKFLAYANPFVDANLDDHFPLMRDEGLLITTPEGDPYVFSAPNGQSSHPDLTLEASQNYVRQALRRMISEHGFDGWMVDFAEWTPLDAVPADGVDPLGFHNRFPELWTKVNREAFDAERPDGDWVTFARSGWTGTQRNSMIHWIGDQEADWSVHDGLPTVVPAMLNLGLAGVPYVTHDIGGFSGGPSTKELFLRWTELGAFTPIMRTHEGNRRQENWNWNRDAETIAHFRRFARIHEALQPLWQQLSDEAEARSTPMVRALALHYPDDTTARVISDQYLLGSDMLVAPVITEGDTTRTLYLPEEIWFHVFTGEMHTGPGTITVDAPIGTPPVFSRGADRPDLRAIEQ